MKRGLAIILAGLLVILLSAVAVSASDSPRPPGQTALPRLFLQTDYLKITAPTIPADSFESPMGYQLDTLFIRDTLYSTPPKTWDSAVELGAEKDLAALRIRTDSSFTPYLGAGMTIAPEPEEAPGLSNFEAEREAERQAYLLGAGLGCDLSQTARLNLGYRYAAGNLPELSGLKLNITETERDDHHISFGLKLDF